MISSVYKLDKIVLPAVEFSEIVNGRWVAGITSMLERPAGHVHPMFRANQQQRPSVEFSTPQIATLLSTMGVGGASLGSVATYFKAASTLGNGARASALHAKITIPQSCAYWSTIRLPHNGRAEASVVLTAQYDGSNFPFVYAGAQALPGSLSADEYFGCGPVSINGTAIPGIKEISIESGVKLIQEGDASEEFDTFVGIEVTEPAVTIKTLEPVNWGTLGLRGTALNGVSGFVGYARRYANTGSRVANNVAQHVLFQVLNGSALPMDSSGEGSSLVTDTLRIEAISATDGVSPLTATTATTIS